MELEPLILDLRDKVTAFNGTLDGLSINHEHAEKDIRELKEDFRAFKDTMWGFINSQKEEINILKTEDKIFKVKLAAGHKFMIWLSLVLSILGSLYALLKEVVHAP